MKTVDANRKSINDVIMKLNKPAYVGIILVYIVILLILTIVFFPKSSFLVIPSYDHHTEAQEIQPLIRIIGIRNVDDNGKVTTNYSIAASLNGKTTETNVAGKYPIGRFQMSSLLESDTVQYFTEQQNRTTPITHTFSLNDLDGKSRIPEEFYIKLNYTDNDNVDQTTTFKEEILKIGNQNQYNNINIIVDKEMEVAEGESQRQVRLNFVGKVEQNNFALRMSIEITDDTRPYHIDMQSWIVTETGEVLPHIGVYGFTTNNSYQTSDGIDLDLKPKYVFSRLVYHEEGKKPQNIYYKESLSNLPTSFNNLPEDPEIPSFKLTFTTIQYIIIGVSVAVIIIAITGAIIKKKKSEDVK